MEVIFCCNSQAVLKKCVGGSLSQVVQCEGWGDDTTQSQVRLGTAWVTPKGLRGITAESSGAGRTTGMRESNQCWLHAKQVSHFHPLLPLWPWNCSVLILVWGFYFGSAQGLLLVKIKGSFLMGFTEPYVLLCLYLEWPWARQEPYIIYYHSSSWSCIYYYLTENFQKWMNLIIIFLVRCSTNT